MDQKRFPHPQAGFSLIEVLVAALIVALAAAGAASAFVSSLNSSGSLRMQAQAQTLAEQSQSRLQSMNIDELSNLDATRTVNVSTPAGASTPFTVHETANYVSDADGEPSCSNPSADYLKTTSTVTWPDMAGRAPVTLSSVLTPSIGEIAADRGTLAVSVIDDQTAGIAGATVTVKEVNGAASASGITSSQGCVLFGDLPVDDYDVSVTPPSGTWVDGKTGQTVSVTAPDTTTATVNAGSTASAAAEVQIGLAGSATFTFATAYPDGTQIAGTPAPAVVLSNPNLISPYYRLCTPADATSGCPVVGSPDTTFPTEATSVSAAPLFPTIYSAYAGVCSNDDPSLPKFGDSDPSVSVSAGPPAAPVTLTLPAMVIQLYSGTSTKPGAVEALPTGASVVITDTGCSNLRYLGYTDTPPPLTVNQAALPLVTGPDDTGLLANPGMPDGTYTVCYQAPGKKYVVPTSVTNHGSGEVINLYARSAKAGTC